MGLNKDGRDNGILNLDGSGGESKAFLFGVDLIVARRKGSGYLKEAGSIGAQSTCRNAGFLIHNFDYGRIESGIGSVSHNTG
jgi:hypothetical protein